MAAEPLDKNRFRIFQPTLGFLSAIGGITGNFERGYPEVLNRLVLKGGHNADGFANSFCAKQAAGKKKVV